MANGDYGYFGKGDTGYAQYMTAARPAAVAETTTTMAVAEEMAADAAA